MLRVCRVHCAVDFLPGNGKLGSQIGPQFFLDALRAVQIEKRIHKDDVLLLKFLHILFDRLRVRGDNGAIIMVIRLFLFLLLIWYTGIKDKFYPLSQQMHHVTVYEFGRIANGFRWNRLHPLLKDLLCGARRELDSKSQLRKKGEPEGIVFVQIENPRNPPPPLWVLGPAAEVYSKKRLAYT